MAALTLLCVKFGASLSFLTNFESVSRGVIDLREVIFFVSMILVTLYINTAIIDLKKSA